MADPFSGRDSDLDASIAVLRGRAVEFDELLRLGRAMRDGRCFGYARQLFAMARKHPAFKSATIAVRHDILQRSALCTYKDTELPADQRFEDALALLAEADLSEAVPSQETLGQAGAVYKNRWRRSGSRRDLETSLSLYRRGYAQGFAGDGGYTAINAAFVHDLLSAQQRDEAPDEAAAHAAAAHDIRAEIAAALPALASERERWRTEWWYYATLAEAHFGLGQHNEARHWLREGLPTSPPDWQLESTTRQLAELAAAQRQSLESQSDAWKTLRVLVGDADDAIRAIAAGKIGLALSGGGFRASLFHIGVLALLAEADLLRHVEVLSCVSGGSIIGAYYYLELRRRLNEKRDAEITRHDYVEIVRRIEHDFLAVVQKNLRTMLFASVVANLRTLLVGGYTRTNFLGELLEAHLYGARTLDELTVVPPDHEGFNPKLDNWRRSAKAPVLLLNATTLNTGHNWQFAVSWMGEPPPTTNSPVARNDLLRRMYYRQAPVPYQHVRIGDAVAASACVPALFDPIELDGLFPGQTVRLVDGGVHDNQGVAGLLEQECAVLLVSDASGQTNVDPHPSGEVVSVGLRANNILMERVREAEFRELDALRRSGSLRSLMFLHLKRDLDVTQLDWINSQDPWTPPDERQLPNTPYGIPKTLQRLLAGIRTDLDAFTESEAYALMLSGYEMAAYDLSSTFRAWPVDRQRESWQFLAIAPIAKRAEGTDRAHAELLRQLSASASLSGKLWKLKPWLFGSLLLIVIATLAASLVAAGVDWRSLLGGSWRAVTFVVGAYAALGGLTWVFHLARGRPKTVTVIATALMMVPLGALAAAIHLAFFNRLYLRLGAVRPPPARAPR